VIAGSTPHHKYMTLSHYPPPPKKKNNKKTKKQQLTKQKSNMQMQQQIQNVIYKSTPFQCLIKPQPKQFHTQVPARWFVE
jgi:hypothetical protein